MNVELLDRVVAYFEEEPRRFDMQDWVRKVSSDVCPCGTVACIAGAALIVSKIPLEVLSGLGFANRRWFNSQGQLCGDAGSVAAELLELSNCEARLLFELDRWPKRFAHDLAACTNEKQAVSVLKDRIAWFKEHLE